MSAPETTNTLRIDYCRDPVGALSRWLWAAHEGKPHNFDRAEVTPGAIEVGKVEEWISQHPLAQGRRVNLVLGKPRCDLKGLFDEHGQLVDRSLYFNDDVDDECSLDFEGLAERVDSGKRGTFDELIVMGVVVEREDGDYLVACPSYPIDEFLPDYMPTMQERILECVRDECTYHGVCSDGDYDKPPIDEEAPRFKQAALELLPLIEDDFTEYFENFKVLIPWDRSELVQAMKETEGDSDDR